MKSVRHNYNSTYVHCFFRFAQKKIYVFQNFREHSLCGVFHNTKNIYGSFLRCGCLCDFDNDSFRDTKYLQSLCVCLVYMQYLIVIFIFNFFLATVVRTNKKQKRNVSTQMSIYLLWIYATFKCCVLSHLQQYNTNPFFSVFLTITIKF